MAKGKQGTPDQQPPEHAAEGAASGSDAAPTAQPPASQGGTAAVATGTAKPDTYDVNGASLEGGDAGAGSLRGKALRATGSPPGSATSACRRSGASTRSGTRGWESRASGG